MGGGRLGKKKAKPARKAVREKKKSGMEETTAGVDWRNGCRVQ